MKQLVFITAFLILSLALFTRYLWPAHAQTSIPAFPGAEGFGAQSVGGRGGRVIEVTNLNDSGDGSLRACVEANGPRTCVFRVGGTIRLQSQPVIRNSYITIAGQTAPGGGIALRMDGNDSGLVIRTHDVIIRHLRIRPGIPSTSCVSCDGVSIQGGSRNVILDHTSISWGTDGNLDFAGGSLHDITIQWSFITECLAWAGHPKGPHSTGVLIGGDERDNVNNISFHHNYLAHNQSRNPRGSGGTLDFVNNVIYNHSGTSGVFRDEFYNGPGHFINYIGNYVSFDGPSSNSPQEKKVVDLDFRGYGGIGMYIKDNISPHVYNNYTLLPDRSPEKDQTSMVSGTQYLVASKYNTPHITIHSAFEARDLVLANAGATLPKRDAVDQRVVNDFYNQTGKIIGDPEERGGYPNLVNGTPYPDTDHDGMADEWEGLHGFNQNDASDNNQDADGDGYTNLEEFLNGTDPNVPEGTAVTPTPTGTSSLKSLLAGWLSQDTSMDRNGDGKINSLDFVKHTGVTGL